MTRHLITAVGGITVVPPELVPPIPPVAPGENPYGGAIYTPISGNSGQQNYITQAMANAQSEPGVFRNIRFRGLTRNSGIMTGVRFEWCVFEGLGVNQCLVLGTNSNASFYNNTFSHCTFHAGEEMSAPYTVNTMTGKPSPAGTQFHDVLFEYCLIGARNPAGKKSWQTDVTAGLSSRISCEFQNTNKPATYGFSNINFEYCIFEATMGEVLDYAGSNNYASTPQDGFSHARGCWFKGGTVGGRDALKTTTTGDSWQRGYTAILVVEGAAREVVFENNIVGMMGHYGLETGANSSTNRYGHNILRNNHFDWRTNPYGTDVSESGMWTNGPDGRHLICARMDYDEVYGNKFYAPAVAADKITVLPQNPALTWSWTPPNYALMCMPFTEYGQTIGTGTIQTDNAIIRSEGGAAPAVIGYCQERAT